MELTLSTHLLVYGSLDEPVLDSLRGSGVEALEVWLAEPHAPWRDAKAVAAFRERLEARGLRAGSVHLPFYPTVSALRERSEKWSVIFPEARDRRTALDAAAEGLHAAAALGASAAVLHLGWQRDDWGRDEHAWAREAVAGLLPVAKACGVRLLLENIISDGTRSAALAALLDEVDPDGEAGICLDLGHAHVEGDILRQLEDALPRLAHLHVHDNDGSRDAHLPPGHGTIPWEPVLRRLDAAGFDGLAALEVRDVSGGREPAAEVLRREIPRMRAFQEQWAAQGLLPAPKAPA